MSQHIASFQLIGSRELAGAEIAMLRLAQALRARDQRVVLGVREGSALARRLDADIPLHRYPMRGLLDMLSAAQIRHDIELEHVDVVQTWATRATWLTRVPGRAVHVARLGGYYKLRYFRHADAWVVNTRGLRDWMVRHGFPPSRVEWIDNFVPATAAGVPLSLTRSSLGISEHARVVIALGRFIDKKGFDDLVAAFAGLPASIDERPLHLVLMGDGPMLAELRVAASAAGCGARVHFTGWIDRAVELLALADVFVCPSREEALGNVVLEAWSARLPVICTETAGGSELISHGSTGLLTPVNDPLRLTRSLERLLRDEDLRAGLAEQGHAHFHRRFSEQKTIGAYLDFYARLLRER